MFTHLLKLIWNKKKQNFLLMSELFVSFLIMFAIFSLVVFYFNNYRKPRGFKYEQLWRISYNRPEENRSLPPDSAELLHNAIKQVIQSDKAIEYTTFTSNNTPYSFNTSNSMVEYNKNSALTNIYITEDNYAATLALKVKEGRWFSKIDNGSNYKSAVVNESLAEKLFGSEKVENKLINFGTEKLKIVGVVEDFKDKGDYEAAGFGLYKRVDTSDVQAAESILVKVNADADAAVESRLHKSLSKALNVSNVEIEHLSDKRISKNNFTLVPMIVLLVIGGFLIINVALGLFGVLWYNINKRRGEIGLRRAIGASGKSISFQLVAEAMVLTTLSLLLGCFFAIQFPLLHVFDVTAGVYLTAICLSVIFIYLLVVLCALYPGKQAAAIYPAVALHEE